MCDELIVIRDGEAHVCEMVGDLRRLLGEPVLIDYGIEPREEAPRDNDCLCHIDVEATAERHGATCRRATEAEGWPFISAVFESPKERANG